MSFAGTPLSPASFRLPSPPEPVRISCFSIVAKADPSVLPRIFDMIAMFDLTPDRCHVSRSDLEPDRPLLIDLQIANLRDEDAHLIEKKLERMVMVTQILISEKRRAAA
ncbi:MAG: hypothetical protein AAGA21_25270 [Pseudomonadota bacterium]